MKKLLLIVLVALVGVLASCLPAEVFTPEESEVELSHWGATSELTTYGNIVVTGYVKNVGSAEAAIVQVEAVFYDASMAILGKYSKLYFRLKPGETWKYSISYLGLNSERVKQFSAHLVEQ